MSRVRTGPLAGWDDKAGVTYERYDGLCVSLALPPGEGWAIVPSTAWAFAMPDDSPLHEIRAMTFATAREAAAVADHKFPPRECYACNSLATGIRSNPEIVDAEIVPPAKPTEDLPLTIDGARYAFACGQHCDGAPEPAPVAEPAPAGALIFVAEWFDSKGRCVASGHGATQDAAETRAAAAFEPVRKKRVRETFAQVIRVSAERSRIL